MYTIYKVHFLIPKGHGDFTSRIQERAISLGALQNRAITMQRQNEFWKPIYKELQESKLIVKNLDSTLYPTMKQTQSNQSICIGCLAKQDDCDGKCQ